MTRSWLGASLRRSKASAFKLALAAALLLSFSWAPASADVAGVSRPPGASRVKVEKCVSVEVPITVDSFGVLLDGIPGQDHEVRLDTAGEAFCSAKAHYKTEDNRRFTVSFLVHWLKVPAYEEDALDEENLRYVSALTERIFLDAIGCGASAWRSQFWVEIYSGVDEVTGEPYTDADCGDMLPNASTNARVVVLSTRWRGAGAVRAWMNGRRKPRSR